MIFVLIPAYNEELFIGETRQCLNSILTKHKVRYVIVVVDDCSSDKTVAVVKRWAKRLPINILKHTHNQGPGKAIFTGMQYIRRRGKSRMNVIRTIMEYVVFLGRFKKIY